MERIPRDQWKSELYMKKNPLGRVPTLETPEGCIYESMAIMRYLARLAGKMYGSNPFESAQIDQWLEYVNTNLNPVLAVLNYTIFGYRPAPKQEYELAQKELNSVLAFLDSHLASNAWFGSGSMSIADVALGVVLRYPFRLLLDAKCRENIPHLSRWFEGVSGHRVFAEHFGKYWPCQQEFQPCFGEEKKAPAKKEGKKESKKEEKKEEAKKKEAPKPKESKKKAEDDDEEEEVKIEKKVNPLDQLPKSPFNIDDWKREFVNAPDKAATLKNIWTIFDPEGWSLWKVRYMKEPRELKTGFLTGNLKNGFIRNIEHFRKYSFGVLGVYGPEGDYDIQGVWMWRGKEVPLEWKEHQSYDSLEFTKLDHTNAEHRQLLEDYWLKLNEGEVVDGLPVFDVKWFK